MRLILTMLSAVFATSLPVSALAQEMTATTSQSRNGQVDASKAGTLVNPNSVRADQVSWMPGPRNRQ